MLPAAITLTLLVTSLIIDRNGVVGESRQSPQAINNECKKAVDDNFIKFAATSKGNISRINKNINKLMKTYVSTCQMR